MVLGRWVVLGRWAVGFFVCRKQRLKEKGRRTVGTGVAVEGGGILLVVRSRFADRLEAGIGFEEDTAVGLGEDIVVDLVVGNVAAGCDHRRRNNFGST